MKASTRRALWVGGLVLGAGAIAGGVAYAATNKKASSDATGPVTAPAMFLKGHRYKITATAPVASVPAGQIDPSAVMDEAQTDLDSFAQGQFKVVSAAVTQNDGNGRTIVTMQVDNLGADYTRPDLPASFIAMLQKDGITISAVDMGLSSAQTTQAPIRTFRAGTARPSGFGRIAPISLLAR